MPDRGAHPYPPVGDPDRLDSILQRGRSLRRRRQLGTVGAGAGGALAVMLVVVLAFGGGSGTSDQLVADDATTTTEATSTTTTTTSLPPTMTVEVLPGGPTRVRVADPAQPTGEGTQQCLLASAYDPAAPAGALPLAQGWSCAGGLSAGGDADLELQSTTSSGAGTDQGAGVEPDLGTGSGVDVGCPAVMTNVPVTAEGTEPGVTTFTLTATGLAPGAYRVELSAVSGIGDGCAPEQTGFEVEHVVESTGTLTLP